MRTTIAAICGTLLLSTACDDEEPQDPQSPDFSILVSDQASMEADRIQVQRIEATEGGFIAIYRIEQGADPALLGAAAFEAGTSSISVDLDEEVPENGTLLARLHRDDGQIGVFENDQDPARDAPILLDGQEVSAQFEFVREVSEDALAAQDPTLLELSVLPVGRVDLQEPGFLRVSQAEAGQSTLPSIGARSLAAGRHLDIEVAIARDLVDQEQIVLTLHDDSDDDGVLSWDGSPQSMDPPLRDDQDEVIEVVLTVSSTLSPAQSILAQDQVATSSTADISLVSVVAAEAGFAAVYALDENDAVVLPSLGSAAVPAGLSVLPSIPDVAVGSSTVAERLRVLLHRDTDANGLLEWDGGDLDAPAIDGDGDPIQAELELIRAVP
ncbi:MAG: hypothetical protein AAGD10_18835 [Myxococcota bacterium]